MGKADDAARMFRDSLQRIDVNKDPVNFNLYKGLMNLAEAVSEIDSKLNTVQNDVRAISTKR